MNARQDEGRGHGIPLTDEERAARHYELYNETTLPARGTGLGQLTVPWIEDNWKGLAIAGGVLLILYLNQESKPAKKKATAKNPRMVTLPMYGGEDKPMKRVRSLSNPQGFCAPYSNQVAVNPLVEDGSSDDMYIFKGNSKIGSSMWNWSMTQGPPSIGGTCPGATSWCREFCYAARGLFIQRDIQRKYALNYTASKRSDFPERVIRFLRAKKPRGPKLFRIHVSGDFYSPEYIRKWIKIAEELKDDDWQFYSYTRCWRLPKFRAALNELKALSNVEIMASTDPVTGPAPAGWREAGVDGSWGGKAVICLAQSLGKKCIQCQFCGPRYKKAHGIYLLVHGITGPTLKFHKEVLKKALKDGYHLAPGASAS